jgi:hypothetical protein
MRSSNTRRGQTSITHLMNISLPPRARIPHYLDQHRNRRFGRHGHSWLGPIDTSRLATPTLTCVV